MIGDSITSYGHWEDIFPSIKIANRGVGGDRTDDIIRRLNSIVSVKPKKALIMAGINDIVLGREINDIVSDYIKIVNVLQDQGVEVLIQSTLECNRAKCGTMLDKVRDLNAKLKGYASEHKIIYININDGLTGEKKGLLNEYTYDGVHLLGGGYVKWSNAIAPFIIKN